MRCRTLGLRRPPCRRHRRRHRRADRPGPLRRQPLHGQDGRGRRPGGARSRRGRDAHPGQRTRSSRRPGAHVARAETAAEMQAALRALTPPEGPAFDVLVMAAAVADFRPAAVADRKLARGDGLTAGAGAHAGPAGRDRRAGAGRQSAASGEAAPSWSASRPRPARWSEPREAAGQGRGHARRQRRERARLGLRHGHEPGHHLHRRTPRPRSCRCCPRARSRGSSWTASWSAWTARRPRADGGTRVSQAPTPAARRPPDDRLDRPPLRRRRSASPC